MTRTTLPAIATAITLLGLVAIGCGDSSGDDDIDAMDPIDAAANVDAEPEPDAPGTPDAAPPDAAPPGMVTITVNDTEGVGIEGVDVVFSDPAGALVSTTQTDANGEASEILGGNSMISVASMQAGGVGPTQFTVLTIGHVQPGDAIVVSDFDAVAPPDQGNVATAAVTWPGTFTNATGYVATEGCNDVEAATPGTPSDLEVDGDCTHSDGGGDQFHVIAQALQLATQQGQFDTVLAASVSSDNDVGNDVTLPAWSDQFTTLPVTIANPPAGVLVFVGGAGFHIDNAFVDIADEALAQSPSYDGLLPQALTPDATELVTGYAFGSFTGLTGLGQYTQSVAGTPAGTSTHDLSMATRPATEGTFSTTDAARPTLDWQASSTANVANFTQAVLTWTDGGGAENHVWIMITDPNEEGPIGFPEMPAALSAYAPTATSMYDVVQVVYYYGDWITEDWPTLRQQAGVSATDQPATGFVESVTVPVFSMGPFFAPSDPAAVYRDTVRRARRYLPHRGWRAGSR